MSYLEKLKVICRENPQRVIFAEANDEHVIKAARILTDQELAKPILFGGAYQVRDLATKINVRTRGLKIINPSHQRETEPYLNRISSQNSTKKLSRFEAGQIAKDPVIQSIFRLKSRHGDIAFAGNRSNTSKVLSAGLKWSGVHSGYNRMSSFYLLISKDNKDIFSFSDCSVNISPNAVQLAEIALKTATNFQRITGRQARVAFLSFSTKGSAIHKKVELVQQAVNIFRKKRSGIICDGELQFDAAVDQIVAQKKAPNGSLNGNANVFIFSSLNSANIGQKIAVQMGGYAAIGPMIQGLNDSLHILSKSSTTEEIINSVLLASVMKIKK
jgi:phosphotransacetylase